MVEHKNSFQLIAVSILLMGVVVGAVASLYNIDVKSLLAVNTFIGVGRDGNNDVEQRSDENVSDTQEEVVIDQGVPVDRIDYPVLHISGDDISIFAPTDDDGRRALEEDRAVQGFGKVYKDIY